MIAIIDDFGIAGPIIDLGATGIFMLMVWRLMVKRIARVIK